MRVSAAGTTEAEDRSRGSFCSLAPVLDLGIVFAYRRGMNPFQEREAGPWQPQRYSSDDPVAVDSGHSVELENQKVPCVADQSGPVEKSQ